MRDIILVNSGIRYRPSEDFVGCFLLTVGVGCEQLCFSSVLMKFI